MRAHIHISFSVGFSLIELLFVLCVLGICFAIGVAMLGAGLSTIEARGSAECWQTAAAWAQVGVLWHGGSTHVAYDAGSLSLSHEYGLCGGHLGRSAPGVPATTNVDRWREPGGVGVVFGGSLASPDGGGSLYFKAQGGAYRVTVRPESGLTGTGALEAAP